MTMIDELPGVSYLGAGEDLLPRTAESFHKLTASAGTASQPWSFSERDACGFRPSHPDGLLWAVLDAGTDLDLVYAAQAAGVELVSLFTGACACSLTEVAPFLCLTPPQSPLVGAFAARRGKGAGLLLDSAAPPEVVFEHLQKIFFGEDETGCGFFFRFYDPAVLRTHLAACTHQERIDLFGPLHGFVLESADPAAGYEFFHLSPEGDLLRSPLGTLFIGR